MFNYAYYRKQKQQLNLDFIRVKKNYTFINILLDKVALKKQPVTTNFTSIFTTRGLWPQSSPEFIDVASVKFIPK